MTVHSIGWPRPGGRHAPDPTELEDAQTELSALSPQFPLATSDCRSHCKEMEFSISTFIVEINGTACAAFQSKWQSEADAVGRRWADDQLRQLAADHGWPPLIRIRIARPAERAAYQNAESPADFEGVAFVNLASVMAAVGEGP